MYILALCIYRLLNIKVREMQVVLERMQAHIGFSYRCIVCIYSYIYILTFLIGV
jgi:hypothetical protein